MRAQYLHEVEAARVGLHVKGQEVERDHVALGLVEHPLTLLVVRVGARVVGGPDLPRTREGATTSWRYRGWGRE